MSPRVLVTGASGFVGGHVAAALWERRQEAHAEGDFALRLLLRDPSSVHDTAYGPGGAVEVVRADLSDPGSLRGVCDGVDVVLHCASHIGDDERLTRAVNDHGTRALMAEAARAGAARTVYVSTAAVYGRGPFTGVLPGGAPPAPASATSAARAAAENHVLDAGGLVLRPHLVLGTGDRWVVPGLAALMGTLSAGLRECGARQSFVDVRALARAVVAAGVAERATGAGVRHVNHPRPVGCSDLLAAVAARLDLCLPGTPLTVEEAHARLDGQPRALHHLGMLTVDHWFADDGFWAGLGIDPGADFERSLTDHASWYREHANR
ncbi:NAD-dependent epimerase/dehydratase family protein [Streptomyces zinciresistens K42]|uniref:NAD-dependent epimerase/dehydratase family protein n=1 Tax=Streptomyces zinciresistens K42 TaxID=700597 RepID=G2GHC9_9ACTN|nr:NAD-dependent epimerase/dehydratase family protein [Streptomyces zinciresistens]EGX57083.1 NAD-dependent epimerase/dehydratase family protein [Streptomyces zinciresistens K42]